MANPVTLVQGASRGLGLSFVRILANRSTNVIATCRNPSQAEELQRCLFILYRENTIQCSKNFHLKWFYDDSFPSNTLMSRHSFKYYVGLEYPNVRHHFLCRKQVLQLSNLQF